MFSCHDWMTAVQEGSNEQEELSLPRASATRAIKKHEVLGGDPRAKNKNRQNLSKIDEEEELKAENRKRRKNERQEETMQ